MQEGSPRRTAARAVAIAAFAATAAVAFTACVPTSDRPTLADPTTTDVSVLGTTIERGSSTTSAPTTSTTAADTTTTAAPTTTTPATSGTVMGTYQARAAGDSVKIDLERSVGGLHASRTATATSERVPFRFSQVTPGRYRIVITDTTPASGGASSVSVVRSVVFEVRPGETAKVTCDPDACTVALLR